MRAFSVFLIAFVTSVLSAAGTAYLIARYDLLPRSEKQAPEAFVPDLRGLSEADARANASAAHVALFVASREQSRDVKPGAVIRQSVAPGQRVAWDHPLNVVIAEVLPKVPALSGLTVADAARRLEERGYRLEVGEPIADPAAAPGLVVNQLPPPDSVQPSGATVTVRVSTGPGEVELPKLVGLGLAKAKTDVEALGLKLVTSWVNLAETPSGVVLSQKPPAGEKVKPGSEVQITLNR